MVMGRTHKTVNVSLALITLGLVLPANPNTNTKTAEFSGELQGHFFSAFKSPPNNLTASKQPPRHHAERTPENAQERATRPPVLTNSQSSKTSFQALRKTFRKTPADKGPDECDCHG
jgi:hypothetical protein